MFIAPMSDLSYNQMQQNSASTLRLSLQAAGYEMSTGLSANLVEALNGNVGEVYEIDLALKLLDQHSTSMTFGANRAATTQTALGNALDALGTVGIDLEGAVAIEDMVSAGLFAASTEQMLETVVGSFNTTYAGRYLFAGAAETTQPLDPAADIIEDIVALIDAAPDATTALADIDFYFDDPTGGFQTTIYNGSAEDAAGILTPDGNRIDYAVRADDGAVKDLLKGLATAAAFGHSTMPGMPGADAEILGASAQSIRDAEQDLIAVRTDLGFAEENIAVTQTLITAEVGALQLAKLELVGVDAFDASVRFADIENQLNALYTVTARVSNLTFTNFLR